MSAPSGVWTCNLWVDMGWNQIQSFISIKCNNMFWLKCCTLKYQVVLTFCKRNRAVVLYKNHFILIAFTKFCVKIYICPQILRPRLKISRVSFYLDTVQENVKYVQWGPSIVSDFELSSTLVLQSISDNMWCDIQIPGNINHYFSNEKW